MSQLESKLASGAYDILFADAEIVTDALRAAAPDVAIVTDSKEKEQIEAAIKSHRG